MSSFRKICFKCKEWTLFKFKETETGWVRECEWCGFKKVRRKTSFSLWWSGDKLFCQKDTELYPKQMILTNSGLKVYRNRQSLF